MQSASLALTLILAGSLHAECRECHPDEAAHHATSAHASALKPVFQSHFFDLLPDRPLGEARGGFLLDYEKRARSLAVTASRGRDASSGVITWVFGAGRRAETPVVARGSEWLEHRISYYSEADRFDLTMGHARGVSPSSGEALGVVQAPDVIHRCFGCHSTGGLPLAASFRPGVQCESCHAGAEQHGKAGGPVFNPGHLKPQASVALCASCHRGGAEGKEDDPINVRYQTVRLRRSKCYLTGKLSCVTCHDPHSDAQRDTAAYSSRCIVCHADQNGRGDCVTCHMARVSIGSRLAFTDHYIRVTSEGKRR